jgi:hypothetical protein
MSQAEKMQEAENAAAQFKYGETEKRQLAQMDRVSSQLSGAENRAASASAAEQSAQASMFSGIGNAVTTGFQTMSAKGNANVAAGLTRGGKKK